MIKTIPSYCLLLLLIVCSCKSTKQTPSEFSNASKTKSTRVAFYNVENLFDTDNHPTKLDDDFTPEGKQNWTAERCEKKLSRIDEVLVGMEYPDFLGLCEVENKKIVDELCKHGGLKKQNYGFEHYDSPDIRGIDNAFIYKKAVFKVIKSYPIPVNIPDSIEADYTTRDILYVKGLYKKDHLLHFFINHWPSRRGGVEKSEPKRTFTATRLRKSVDSLLNINAFSNIIIMGDFNDEPDNKSVREVLRAEKEIPENNGSILKNMAWTLDEQKKGSYNYRGNWNMLDQIIVSANLTGLSKELSKNDTRIEASNQKILDEEWLMYKDPKHGLRPNRTYGGPNYYGGYSDHLPVYVDINFSKNKK